MVFTMADGERLLVYHLPNKAGKGHPEVGSCSERMTFGEMSGKTGHVSPEGTVFAGKIWGCVQMYKNEWNCSLESYYV